MARRLVTFNGNRNLLVFFLLFFFMWEHKTLTYTVNRAVNYTKKKRNRFIAFDQRFSFWPNKILYSIYIIITVFIVRFTAENATFDQENGQNRYKFDSGLSQKVLLFRVYQYKCIRLTQNIEESKLPFMLTYRIQLRLEFSYPSMSWG